ncbi:uncharacterized protein LOC135696605 isoform X3 [Rhopilema esculentum]
MMSDIQVSEVADHVVSNSEKPDSLADTNSNKRGNSANPDSEKSESNSEGADHVVLNSEMPESFADANSNKRGNSVNPDSEKSESNSEGADHVVSNSEMPDSFADANSNKRTNIKSCHKEKNILYSETLAYQIDERSSNLEEQGIRQQGPVSYTDDFTCVPVQESDDSFGTEEITNSFNALKDNEVKKILSEPQPVRYVDLFVLGPTTAETSSLVESLCGKEFVPDGHTAKGAKKSRTVTINDHWNEEDVIVKILDDCFKRMQIQPINGCEESGGNYQDSIIPKEPVPDNTSTSNLIQITKIWHFPGDSPCQKMFRIFASANSMYLLCFDFREHNKDPYKNLEKLKHWLTSVASYNKHKPPVFLIATHMDGFESDKIDDAQKFLHKELYEGFGSYLAKNEHCILFPIENSKGHEGVDVLKRCIEKEAKDILSSDPKIGWLVCENLIHKQVRNDGKIFAIAKDVLIDKLKESRCLGDETQLEGLLRHLHENKIICLPELMKLKKRPLSLEKMAIVNLEPVMEAIGHLWKFSTSDPERKMHEYKVRLAKESRISRKGLKELFENRHPPFDKLIGVMVLFNILVECDVNGQENNRVEDNMSDKWKRFEHHGQTGLLLVDFFGFVSEDVYWQLLARVYGFCKLSEPSKFDAIFCYDEKAFRLIYDPANGHIRCKVRGNSEVLIQKLKETLCEICSDLFNHQKFQFLVQCPEFCLRVGNWSKNISVSFQDDDIDGNKPMFFAPLGEEPCMTCLAGSHPNQDLYYKPSSSVEKIVLSVTGSEETHLNVPIAKNMGLVDKIGEKLGSCWENFARNLEWPKDLDCKTKIDNIRCDNNAHAKPQAKAVAMLSEWMQAYGPDANFGKLFTAANKMGNRDIAQFISENIDFHASNL